MLGLRGVRGSWSPLARSWHRPQIALALAVALALAASACLIPGAAAAGTALPHFDAGLVHASVPKIVRADQGPAEVSVRTRSRVTGLTVTVNGSRHAAIRFVRLSALQWRVILPHHILDGGLNAVSIVAHVGRRWGAAYPSFQYLFPRPGLIRVLSPRPRSNERGLLRQTFALAHGVTVHASLNGHSEAAQVHPANERLVHGQLRLHFVAGVSLGLRSGINRLVVTATKGRFYTRVIREVRVRSTGLPPGASPPPATTTAPAPLVQVQTESQNGAGITVNNQFYANPVSNSGQGAVAAFALNRSTLQLISSQSLPLSGIAAWIASAQQTQADPIVILQTGGGGASYSGNALAQFNAALADIGAAPVSVPNGQLPNFFVAIGGPQLPPGTATQSCAQAPPGVDPERCAISGYFFSPVGPSVTGNYIFEPGAYVPFTLTPTPAGQPLTNAITVGGQSVSAPPFPAGSGGGYHVVVVDRYTLAVLSNEVFATGDAGTESAAEQAMLALLDGAVSNPSQMVLMTSVGQPLPATGANPNPAAANGILAAINQLGGTPDVFARATGGQTYSLVGIAGDVDYGDVAEASSDSPPPGVASSQDPGSIDGVLARGIRNYAFEPYLDSPEQINTNVFSAIYQPPTTWPDSGDPGYAAASAYIAGQLFPNANPSVTNVRAEYDNLNISFAALISDLPTVKYPEQASFPAATFNALMADYQNEFSEIANVRNFFTNIKEPITAEAADNFQELNAIEMAISNAVQPPPPSQSVDVSDILATIQGVADLVGVAELVSPELEGLANTGSVLSALLGISAGATALGASGDGGAATDDTVQTTAGKVEASIAIDQAQVVSTLNNLEDETVLDSGRLTAMDKLAVNTDVTGGTMNALNDDYTLSLKREFTSALVTTNWTFSQNFDLPVKPPTWISTPGQSANDLRPGPALNDIRDYDCTGDESGFTDYIHPFNQMDPNTEYAPITSFNATGNPLQTVFFITAAERGTGHTDDDEIDQCSRHWPVHDFASGPVFDAMFKPLGTTENVNGNPLDTLAFVRAQWWWRNFSGGCWSFFESNVGNYFPNCAPGANAYQPTAAAWTQPALSSSGG